MFQISSRSVSENRILEIKKIEVKGGLFYSSSIQSIRQAVNSSYLEEGSIPLEEVICATQKHGVRSGRYDRKKLDSYIRSRSRVFIFQKLSSPHDIHMTGHGKFQLTFTIRNKSMGTKEPPLFHSSSYRTLVISANQCLEGFLS